MANRTGDRGPKRASSALRLPEGVSQRRWAACFSPRIQELIILPTEKCNFRCSYCYEDFKIGKMPPWVRRGIENLITQRAPTLDFLQLSWFGGEPLLAREVILQLARHAHALSKKHAFHLSGSFTTNGFLLTPDLAGELIALNQNRFQISLDGWQDGHDKTRRMANGGGSFSIIWNNLLALAKAPTRHEVSLRVHVTPDNGASTERLCVEIARNFGNDPRFYVNFQDVRDLGGQGGTRVSAWNGRALRERIDRLTAVLLSTSPEMRRRISNNLDATGESAGGRSADELHEGGTYICYASKPNSILIRADGRLGKCTVAFDRPENDIGEIREDGTLRVDGSRLQRWFHGLGSLDLDALGCPAKTMASASHSTRKAFPVPVRFVPGTRR